MRDMTIVNIGQKTTSGPCGVGADALLCDCKEEMRAGAVMHHRFLREFQRGGLSRVRLCSFLIQWFKMSTAHRRAFPALVANVKDDDVRFDLVGILNEEYGEGDRSRIHVRLLERLLSAVGVNVATARAARPLSSVVTFESKLFDIWSNSTEAEAFGLHFGLEYLASAQQHYCAVGMRSYSDLTPFDREYFDLHAEAELRHIATSEGGFLHYGRTPEGPGLLRRGVALANRLLGDVWDDFDTLLYFDRSV
jgi:pyrroloquinoline quinone (PQQ) biosynthesis protein C